MVGTADVIRNAKSTQRPLLQRYDIPVEHLSYEYISKCESPKQLERIVTILRSGEEGYYPNLLKHAEKRLNVIKPTSMILRKSEPILKRSMLESNECKEIDKNMNDWMSEMRIRERDLERRKITISDFITPAIRQFKEQSVKKNSARNHRSAVGKRIASCDYAAWDRYDVDIELKKIDIQDEQEKVEAKRLQKKQKETLEKEKTKNCTAINKTATLTETELSVMAEQEKEKGNEAYRTEDYEEALEHYNTSIKINSNIMTYYNNRAMTYIKLQRYQDAINDCNIVLSAEHTNIKALLRRAVSLEFLGNLSQALADYEAALKLAPNDKTAIAGVKKLRKPCVSKIVRMIINEQTEDTNKRSQSNKIEESNCFSQFDPTSDDIPDYMCFCDRGPGPSNCLTPLPHVKEEYCIEKDNIEITKTLKNIKKEYNIARKAFNLNTVLTEIYLNFSSNIPEEKSNPVLGTKQKSIFSVTRPPQTSSVIIEELPNEPTDNNVNVRIKSNKTVANMNTKVTNNSQTNANKQVEVPNAKNLNTNSERSGNSNNKCNTISSEKVKVADKYKNKTSKPEKYIPKDSESVVNGYEFISLWRSLESDTDLEIYAELLRLLDVNKLNSGNELDGNMYSIIVRCLERYFCTSNNTEQLSNFLKSFCQINRFKIVNMFTSREDKRVIKNIFNFLEEHGTSGVSSLRQIYCI